VTAERTSAGIWAPPVAWAVLLGAGVRVGRLPAPEALAAALAVLAAMGLARAMTGSRGGLWGRAAELALLPAGIATLLAEPGGFRRIVLLAVATLAAALALAGVRLAGGRRGARALPAAAALAAAALLLPGLAGAPLAGPKWAFATLCLLTATLALDRLADADAAALAAAALAASIGPAHTAPWLLLPLTAGGLLALERDRPLPAALAGAACALLPPAGLAPGLALVGGAALRSRAARPLAALLPMAAVAWWRWPAGASLPGLDGVRLAVPGGFQALPFLLPVLALGLLEPPEGRRDLRPVLGLGLAALPVLGSGPALAAASAAVWLAALPGAARRLARPGGGNTVPWTVAAAAALLLLAPWGGTLAPVVTSPAVLTGGWTVALLLSLLPSPVAALAWLLPAAALAWTVPVEGADRVLRPGQRLEVEEPGGVVLLARFPGHPPLDAGEPAVRAGEAGALLAGRDVPLPGRTPNHPLTLAAGSGRSARAVPAGVSVRHAGRLTLEAAVPVVVRTEPLDRWKARRRRFAGLLGGVAILLALALLAGRAPPAAWAGTAALLLAALAGGSGAAPLARLAFRGAADLAALGFLAAWLALRGRARSRLLAGALLLVPLALAQPLLRHPAGDEVYHLELMESMSRDHDLDLSNNLDPSDPSQAIYLRHRDRLVHSPAEAALLLPGFAAGGMAGALALLALGMAWALALAASRAEALGFPRRRVEAAWLLSLATYPAVTFATQIWPAAAGALALALALTLAARERAVASAAAAALAAAVKVRLALLAAPVALAAALRRRRALLPVLAVLALGAAAAAAVFGSPLGRHALAELVPGSVHRAVRGLWGVVWDPAGGLAFAAPLWLAAVLAVPALWRRGGPGERAALAGAAATLALLAPRGEWYGGGAPPARYLVPLLPLVLLLLAALLTSPRGRRVAAAALPPAVAASWIAVTRPLWWFNPVDGGWWLADGLSRALGAGARGLFPSLLRSRTAALWLVPALLAATAWWWSRRPRGGAAALPVAGLALAIGVAAGLPERSVEAEDPQVLHHGGTAVPPPGAFARWAHGISWRLGPGDGLEIPWRPVQGRRLTVRVRSQSGRPAVLEASWDGAPPGILALPPGRWRTLPLPRPPGPGRHRLRIRNAGGTPVLVDRVR